MRNQLYKNDKIDMDDIRYYDLFEELRYSSGHSFGRGNSLLEQMGGFEEYINNLPNSFSEELRKRILIKEKYVWLKVAMNRTDKQSARHAISRARECSEALGIPLAQSVEDYVLIKSREAEEGDRWRSLNRLAHTLDSIHTNIEDWRDNAEWFKREGEEYGFDFTTFGEDVVKRIEQKYGLQIFENP
tara:strand:- start:532 stop:1092 length:561 start_codon:yes stop_codon:yes gene_type:complete